MAATLFVRKWEGVDALPFKTMAIGQSCGLEGATEAQKFEAADEFRKVAAARKLKPAIVPTPGANFVRFWLVHNVSAKTDPAKTMIIKPLVPPGRPVGVESGTIAALEPGCSMMITRNGRVEQALRNLVSRIAKKVGSKLRLTKLSDDEFLVTNTDAVAIKESDEVF